MVDSWDYCDLLCFSWGKHLKSFVFQFSFNFQLIKGQSRTVRMIASTLTSLELSAYKSCQCSRVALCRWNTQLIFISLIKMNFWKSVDFQENFFLNLYFLAQPVFSATYSIGVLDCRNGAESDQWKLGKELVREEGAAIQKFVPVAPSNALKTKWKTNKQTNTSPQTNQLSSQYPRVI